MLLMALMHLCCFRQETLASQLKLQVRESGRCVSLAESADAKVRPHDRIAPGEPPLLQFRYYEGKAHHRLGNSDLMLDDAGH